MEAIIKLISLAAVHNQNAKEIVFPSFLIS